jgi:hypothetical protein
MRRGYRDDPETGALPGERNFRAGRLQVRYLLELGTQQPHVLVVSFAAWHDAHEAPRYYTLRALRALSCNRLFVLDDHGPSGQYPRPSWYLGQKRATDVPDAVCQLIEALAAELHVTRESLITCGASKGGWASLFFGARVGAGHAIAGEPQVFLGRHLLQEDTYDIATHVAGGTSEADGEFLDRLLFDAMRLAATPPTVHLYCGAGGFYHRHHASPLCTFLDQLGLEYKLDLGEHANHVPDLGLHFPAYLTSKISLLTATDQR